MAAEDKRPWNPTVFSEVIRVYIGHSIKEADRVKRNLFGLSDDDKAELVWKPEDQVARMKEAVQANMIFLNSLSGMITKADPLPGAEHPSGVKPVQNLLHTVAREWSAEGWEERRQCWERLLGALDGHLGERARAAGGSEAAKPRVLCPASDLGRLPYDIQCRGYVCDSCEHRVLHYMCSEYIRQHGKKESTIVQPFALNTCNRFEREDHVRKTPFPDVDLEPGSIPKALFGDFTQLYDSPETRASYDALVSAFAVDSSPNVFRFVRTAAHVVKPGGLWTNFGPLAYDTDHDEGHGHGIELSWEELRHAISFFFEVKEEAFVDSLHAANGRSMMQIEYSCVFFSAVRNDKPAVGIGGTTE